MNCIHQKLIEQGLSYVLDKQKLGFEIKRWRKMKKMTQSQLAEKICNQSEISRIEAGDFFPSIEILYLISNKLRVPIDIFFNALNHEELEEMKAIQKTVWKLSISKNYEDLLPYVEKLLSKKMGFHPEMEKFLLWQKYIAQYCLKKIDWQYCLAEISLLLRKNTIGTDRELDLHIKVSTANILAENKSYNKSITLYKEILKEKLETPAADKIKIKAYYNYGKLLFLKKDFPTALEVTADGIALSSSTNDMSLLGQFFFQKGAIMEELHFPPDKIAVNYKKAAFFFDELGLQVYKNILAEKKASFLTRF